MTNHKVILISTIFLSYTSIFAEAAICDLSYGCEYHNFDYIDQFFNEEFVSSEPVENTIRCDIRNDPTRFNRTRGEWTALDRCMKKYGVLGAIEFISPQKTKQKMLDSSFGLTYFMRFLGRFTNNWYLRLTNLAGIGVDLYEPGLSSPRDLLISIEFVNSRFEFYIVSKNPKKPYVPTCQQMIDAGLNSPRSVFQMSPTNGLKRFVLFNCHFRKPICPLMFSNFKSVNVIIYGMTFSFIRTNRLRFTNDTFENLNVKINEMQVFNRDFIEVDTEFVHPSVFRQLQSLILWRPVRRIQPDVFRRSLISVRNFQIDFRSWRQCIHSREGIAWIRAINENVKVNLSDLESIKAKQNNAFYLKISFYNTVRLDKTFPDKDFCIYTKFPFDQLVIVLLRFGRTGVPKEFVIRFTCTYSWLTKLYYKLDRSLTEAPEQITSVLHYHMSLNRPKCDFNRMIKRCNRSNFGAKPLTWTFVESVVFANILQLSSTILIFSIGFVGILNNFIIARVIFCQKNQETFKNCNQFVYLGWNSIFSIVILVIQLFSRMSDCTIKYTISCPNTRKIVAVQFFKLIFKEGLVTACRFMCNFTYLAFSLNRISLIGKDHGVIVKFFAKQRIIKLYIGVTILISVGLSVVKGFKYKINYDNAVLSYPIQIEADLWLNFSWKKNLYLFVNLTSDLINYIIFVIVNLSIDVYMVIKLKKTLIEKGERFEQYSADDKFTHQKSLKAAKEQQEAVNKVIKMVVLTNLINVLFKFPLAVKPIVNIVAEFYFKELDRNGQTPGFRIFFEHFLNTGLYHAIPDACDMVYTVAITSQLLIYNKFDKKFRAGFKNYFSKESLKSNQSKKDSKTSGNYH